MGASNFDVVVVGAGAAGLTAAVGLARAGFAVAVLETAAFPGAENWSGCVYFCENLAHPDVLGPDGVEALAWERRLVERGLFATDGHGLLGLTYRDAAVFRHCYTVLRPVYDHHLAQVALGLGVALLCGTTAESLVREGGRVVGVCTNRGPLYADLVFLAEGDASHLVAREGYERSDDPRDAPRFLLGIKQVIDLPPGAVERTFGVGPDEGVAYELLLRNGTLRGRGVRLNMRGFVYTNRQSLSVGLVLPADNLRAHFEGDPSLLLEWFLNLPALRPWLAGGRRGTFSAKLIRGGGARDIPRLVDDGLAVGGAASAVGVNFLYPNFTGPATATGLLLARAARAIRAEGGRYTRAALTRHYLEPLRRAHYWKDVEFLRRWPGYVRRTRVLFDRALDLALGTAHVWATPNRGLLGKGAAWLRLAKHLAGPAHWPELRSDLRHLGRALHAQEVVGRPAVWRLLLDGALNSLRDLCRRPRLNLPPGGSVRLHYALGGDRRPEARPPAPLRRWFRRFAPVLASAAGQVYANDDRPLAQKLPAAARTLLRQVNLADVLVAVGLGAAAGAYGVIRATWNRLADLVLPGRRLRPARDPCPEYTAAAGRAGELQGIANPEYRINGEAGWRTSDLVDRARDGTQRFIYAVTSPAVSRLLDAVHAAGPARPVAPRRLDYWEPLLLEVAAGQSGDSSEFRSAHVPDGLPELLALLDQIEHKLEEFSSALAAGPRPVGRNRGEHLDLLARYAERLATRFHEVLAGAARWPGREPLRQALLALGRATADKLEERSRRAWDGHYGWADSDGRQVIQHHLVGLRRLLAACTADGPEAPPQPDPALRWLRAKADAAAPEEDLAAWRARLFHDEESRDAAGKFNAAKKRIAQTAARRYVLETLAHALSPSDLSPASERRAFLARCLAAECLGAASGSRASQAENTATYLAHGEDLLRADEAALAAWSLPLEGEEDMRAQAAQRMALQAELDELRGLEAAFDRLVRGVGKGAALSRPRGAELAEKVGRQSALLLGARCLLLGTHARLEHGREAEIEVALLRVWLEEVAAAQQELEDVVRRANEPDGRGDDRPVVEPDAGPAHRTYGDYLAAALPYDSGDYLVAPVDLSQPRLVPELFSAGSLERLDAGRAGSSASAAAQMDGLISQSREVARAGRAEALARVRWRLERMEEDRFIAEAVAWELVGRLDHPQTKSVRIESAAAELLNTALLQEVIELAEDVHGLAGQAPEHLVEKHKSDDRPPTLCQGASEVQRLFVLKELAAEVAPRWSHSAGPAVPRHLGRQALELEVLKVSFRKQVDAGLSLFGQGLWQDPNLQPTGFLLAEAAAWIQAADSSLYRLGWLSRLDEEGENNLEPSLALGRRAFARGRLEVSSRLARFEKQLGLLRRGHYPPEVYAASRLLDRTEAPARTPPGGNRVRRPLSVLVLVEPGPAGLPEPHVSGGRLLEAHLTWGEADRSALETALRLREGAEADVRVLVAAVGREGAAQTLREAISLGASATRLIVPPADAVSPDAAAAALAAVLGREGPFDLALFGSAGPDLQKGVAGRLAAERLGIPFAGAASHVTVVADAAGEVVLLGDAGGNRRGERPLPAAVAVEAGVVLRPFSTDGYLRGLGQAVQIVRPAGAAQPEGTVCRWMSPSWPIVR